MAAATAADADDWTCDSCTFINSSLLPACELCNAPRSGAGGPAHTQQHAGAGSAEDDGPILLSDDDANGDGAAAAGPRHVGRGERTQAGGSAHAAPLPTTAQAGSHARGHDDDAIVIDDDDEPVNTDRNASGTGVGVVDLTEDRPGSSGLGSNRSRLGPAATGAHARQPDSGDRVPSSRGVAVAGPSGRGDDESFTLDSCCCSLPLRLLADRLQPALDAAAASTTGAAAAVAVPARASRGRRAGAGGGGAAAGPAPPTLYDLASPLACPALGCCRALSGRDVRLLLGPYGTHTLYGGVCAALRREAKAAKAALQERGLGGGSGDGSAGASRAAAAAAAPPPPPPPPPARGKRGGRRRGGRSGASAAANDAAEGTSPTPTAAAAAAGGAGRDAGAPAVAAALPLLPLAPSCPSCGSRMLPTSTLSKQHQQQQQRSGGASAVHAQLAAPTAAQLRSALTARGLRPPAAAAAGGRNGAAATEAEAASLAAAVLEAVGPRCAFLCPDCDGCVGGAGNASEEDGLKAVPVLPWEGMQALQSSAHAACRALKLLRRVRAVLLSADDDEEEDGEGGGADGGGGGTKGGRGGRGGSGGGGRKRSRSGGSGGAAWAKGVGYGGGGVGGREDGGAARQAAQRRQEQADEEVRSCLVDLSDIIAASCRGGGAAAHGGSGGGAAAAMASPPPVLLAALQYGGLPYVLRLLLQNDSLLDMGQRQGLYGAALALVRRFTSDMTLLELLVLPATDPRDSSAGGAAAGAEGGGGAAGPSAAASPSDPPLSAVFESLGRQCSVFKRAAEDLADGAEEDIAALSLALELGALAEEVAGGVAMWRANMGGAQGILRPLLVLPGDRNAAPAAAAAVPVGGPTGADAADERPAKRVTRRSGGSAAAAAAAPSNAVGGGGGAANAAAAADAAAAAAARRSDYVSTMRPLQFREVPLQASHYFKSQARGGGSSGEVMRVRLRRITGEISGLASGLPLDWEAAAFVAVDESRVDVLRALLLPASDTPYANGPFIFDIFLPHNYPNVPPQVQFLTTGGGRVRFNPNLYAEGKVCLSLLGTWSGPSWDPAMSTILQVLVSIQSMILVSDPYYNEPGWERQAHTASGRQAAAEYSNSQRYNTLAFAILPALKMCAAAAGRGHSGWDKALDGGSTFTDVLTRHYTLKRPEVLRQVDEWSAAIAEAAEAARVRHTTGGGGGGMAAAYGGMAMAAAAAAAGSFPPPPPPNQQQETPPEQLHRYTQQVVPQIKQLLQQL